MFALQSHLYFFSPVNSNIVLLQRFIYYKVNHPSIIMPTLTFRKPDNRSKIEISGQNLNSSIYILIIGFSFMDGIGTISVHVIYENDQKIICDKKKVGNLEIGSSNPRRSLRVNMSLNNNSKEIIS